MSPIRLKFGSAELSVWPYEQIEPMKTPLYLSIIALVSILSACTTSSVIMPAQGGIYTVSKSGTTGFTPLGVLRKEAFKEINAFAEQKNKIPEVISVNEVPAGFARWPQVDVKFRLVDEIKESNPSLVASSNSSYDAMGRAQSNDIQVDAEQKVDVYEELKKLGELKESGVLTEEEFLKEKERLLSSER